jgi:hypothetical protein
MNYLPLNLLHTTYLPFTENEFKNHFIFIKGKGISNIDKHISYYKNSIDRYREYESGNSIAKNRVKHVRQIEKDEKFWTASTFMTLFHSKTSEAQLIMMLEKAYGKTPPLRNFNSWKDCFEGELHLYFEPNLQSPKLYLDYLKNNLTVNHFIPYVLNNATNKNGQFRTNLEGPTNVDALIINSNNGFAILIEAKVLSDISDDVNYNIFRNQIIRSIDVMLYPNPNLTHPLEKRIPDNTLFLLVTPEAFKNNPHTRLYGYKYHDYKKNPDTIAKDLPHRNLSSQEASVISSRVGWTTWEDLKRINSNCCKWLP